MSWMTNQLNALQQECRGCGAAIEHDRRTCSYCLRPHGLFGGVVERFRDAGRLCSPFSVFASEDIDEPEETKYYFGMSPPNDGYQYIECTLMTDTTKRWVRGRFMGTFI